MKVLKSTNQKHYRSIKEWGLVLGIFLLFFGFASTNYKVVLLYSLVLTPITLGASAILQKKLIPRFLEQGRGLHFFVYCLSLIFATSLISLAILLTSVGYVPGLDISELPKGAKNYTLMLALMYLIILSLNFLNQWRKKKQVEVEKSALRAEMLQKEIDFKQQELHYLKGQLQPHFLFNTLNSIYGQALKKSDETPQLVLKLSDLLNYTLYQTNKETVGLVDEIDQIRQYAELEKIRFGNSLSFSLLEDLEGDTLQVPPLLLLPLVENAFKHGTQHEGVLTVSIQIKLDSQGLLFSVSNSSEVQEGGTGIGLSNLKKRLDSLYPNRHRLNISHKDSTFVAEMHIDSPHIIST